MTVAAPLVFAFAIYVFAHEAGPFSRLLKSKPVRRLGDWSYSIYMTHVLVITVVLELLRGFEKFAGTHVLRPVDGFASDMFTLTLPHAALLADALTLTYLVAALVLSALTFRFIEVPAREYFARLADRLLGPATARTKIGWRPVRVAAQPR
jgi:peptidoglycan/LPS O-acetylase OafA/YrhL